MLKPLTVVHAHKQKLIVFDSLPANVTPQEAMQLARAIQDGGIDAL